MMRPRRIEMAMVGSLLLVTAVWGLTFVTVQQAVAGFPVLAFVGWRFVAATVLLLPFTWRSLVQMGWQGVVSGLGIGVFLAAGYVLQTFGLTLLPVPTVGFITGLVVILTPLLAVIVLHHRPPAVVWAGAAIATVGLWLLTGAGRGFGLGDLLVLASALAFAAQILGTEGAVRRFPFGGLVLVETALTGLLGLGAASLTHQLAWPHLAVTWWALGITAVFASVGGGLVQGWVQTRLAAARAAVIMSAEPAFAALFAYLLQGALLSAIGWVGAGLIMVAVLLVEVRPALGRRRRLKAETEP